MIDFDAKEYISQKAEAFKDSNEGKKWFEKNYELFRRAFEDIKIRDFIFEPFKEVFATTGTTDDDKIRSVITQVAVANMVLAGLPGKLGVGVYVSIGLEAWMALKIAGQIGIEYKKPSDIFKYFGVISGVFLTITVLFKELLGIAFSLFSIIPMVNPLILAELAITDLVGVLFWVGFIEAKKSGSFTIPKRAVQSIAKSTKDIFNYQKDILVGLLNPENLNSVRKKLVAWFNGDIIVNKAGMRGEIFHVAAMMYLIQGKYDSLDGPMGEIFVDSIRRGYSTKLGDATLEEMSEYFQGRTPEQLRGDISLVKGEMFENLIEKYENTDGDEWIAKLHEERNFPGTDIVFTNIESGETIEVQLKAVSTPSIIESAMQKYPDVPIITTAEMEEYFGENPFIDYSNLTDDELEQVTSENFDILVNRLEPIDAGETVSGGVIAKSMGMLWPFIMAYIRKRIDYEHLEQAMVRVLGETGKMLASRIAYAIILGPVFAWYLLARGMLMLTRGAESLSRNRILVQA